MTKEAENYVNILRKPENGTIHCIFDLGDRFGRSGLAEDLIASIPKIWELVTGYPPGIILNSIQEEWDTWIERRFDVLTPEEMTWLVDQLNQGQEGDRFKLGEIKKFKN